MKFSILGSLIFVAVFSVTGLSQIRSIDFANFSYRWPPDLIDPSNPETHFTLIKGEVPVLRNSTGHVSNIGVNLGSVIFGDVTGDGKDDAVVRMSLVTGGSSMPNIVYVFTMKAGQPRMIWAQTTGDRADGGLRNVYIHDGSLVLELNSPIGARGDCCPTRFTRTTYKWVKNAFQRVKRETELVPVS